MHTYANGGLLGRPQHVLAVGGRAAVFTRERGPHCLLIDHAVARHHLGGEMQLEALHDRAASSCVGSAAIAWGWGEVIGNS